MLAAMGRYETRIWKPSYRGISRRDRLGGTYDVYHPEPLHGWDPDVPADVAADIADAEREVSTLQGGGVGHVSLEGLARFLLRAESVSSSHIEGLSAAARRLARAEETLRAGKETDDRAAAEILGNIHAMERAVEAGAAETDVTVETILGIHRALMAKAPGTPIGGVIREVQNWIGGSSHNPCAAEFVPPPPEAVPGLLEDLAAYVSGDAHSPVLQAAIAHAQLETIHPFLDGNGRAGRALIHVILRRRGLADRFVPPVSLVLATWSRDYVSGLMAFRHVGPAGGPERSAALQSFARTFAAAMRRSCADAADYAERIESLQVTWREAVGSIRAGSGKDRLLAALPGLPVLTRETAARHLSLSKERAGDAIDALLGAGVIVQRNVGRQRYRVFEVPDVLDLFTHLERRLASPGGDTKTSGVVRPVPDRPG